MPLKETEANTANAYKIHFVINTNITDDNVEKQSHLQ